MRTGDERERLWNEWGGRTRSGLIVRMAIDDVEARAELWAYNPTLSRSKLVWQSRRPLLPTELPTGALAAQHTATLVKNLDTMGWPGLPL